MIKVNNCGITVIRPYKTLLALFCVTGLLTFILLVYLLIVETNPFGLSLLSLLPVLPFVLIIYVYFLTQKVVISGREISCYSWLWFKKTIRVENIEKWSVMVSSNRSIGQLKPMIRLEIHSIKDSAASTIIIGLRPYSEDDVNRIINALPSNKGVADQSNGISAGKVSRPERA
ncbi:MAG: hypothetical protein JXA04_10870 [Gammaproteobacteria bacterium]|nr:hypothetical protein [Gammaproteobacteria bacterium]